MTPTLGQLVCYRTGGGREWFGCFTGMNGSKYELDGWITVLPSEVTRLLPMAQEVAESFSANSPDAETAELKRMYAVERK